MSQLEDLLQFTSDNPLNIISGPSGVGKSSITKILREDPQFFFSVSYTTRNLRPGEIDGVDYIPLAEDKFFDLIKADEFLEFAQVHNSFFYGTPISPLIKALKNNQKCLLEIDLQGAKKIRRLLPKSNFIFLNPPSFETLSERLIARNTENTSNQEKRLQTARNELKHDFEFDYHLVNQDLEQSVQEIRAILSQKSINQ